MEQKRSNERELAVDTLQLARELGFVKEEPTQFDLRSWLKSVHAIDIRVNWVTGGNEYCYTALNSELDEILFGERENSRDYYQAVDFAMDHALIYVKLGPIPQERMWTEAQYRGATDLSKAYTMLQLKEFKAASDLHPREEALVDLALDIQRKELATKLTASRKEQSDGKVEEKKEVEENG